MCEVSVGLWPDLFFVVLNSNFFDPLPDFLMTS